MNSATLNGVLANDEIRLPASLGIDCLKLAGRLKRFLRRLFADIQSLCQKRINESVDLVVCRFDDQVYVPITRSKSSTSESSARRHVRTVRSCRARAWRPSLDEVRRIELVVVIVYALDRRAHGARSFVATSAIPLMGTAEMRLSRSYGSCPG